VEFIDNIEGIVGLTIHSVKEGSDNDGECIAIFFGDKVIERYITISSKHGWDSESEIIINNDLYPSEKFQLGIISEEEYRGHSNRLASEREYAQREQDLFTLKRLKMKYES